MEPRMRIGDAEREHTVATLQQYVADGYLTLDEFSERSAAAYRAKTRGELAVLTGDLAPRTDSAPAPRPTRIPWTPVAVVVAVVIGLVVLAGAAMVAMMLAMMS